MFEQLASFTKDVSDLADKPVLDPAVMKAQFDASPNEVREYLNKLIVALKLTTAGDSGAKNIGATNITGLTGSDVQSLLESLKTVSDGLYLNGAGQRIEIVEVTFSPNGSSATVSGNGTFAKPFTVKPDVSPMYITSQNVAYSDSIKYPFIFNGTTTGFSVNLGAIGGNFGAGTMKMKFLAIGK